MSILNLPNERELVERAKTDDAAFGELYDFYFPKIYGYVIKRVGHEPTAEDIVSDTFMKAVAALPRYRVGATPFGAWLFRIATNLLTDHYRKAGRNRSVPLEAIAEAHDPLQDPVQEAAVRMESERLRTMLTTLPPRDQEVIQLKFFSGLSNQEIASVLGCTPNHVGVLLFRAIKKAGALYQPYV